MARFFAWLFDLAGRLFLVATCLFMIYSLALAFADRGALSPEIALFNIFIVGSIGVGVSLVLRGFSDAYRASLPLPPVPAKPIDMAWLSANGGFGL